MQDATADVSDTADQQDHPLQAQLADQDYDEEGMFEGQPLTILFDLNGGFSRVYAAREHNIPATSRSDIDRKRTHSSSREC